MLEIAAGTGVVTRKLASVLPAGVSIVATDLNQPMLDLAAEIGTKRPVKWRQADAMQLPFEDGAFDAVVCQFGVMFFPDKPKAFSEARRVLRSGGVLIFNVWDRIEENEFADTVTTALASIFPDDPPRFMARMPHGYHDVATIARDLERRRVRLVARINTVAARSGRRRRGFPRSRTARERRCVTRSRRATSRGSAKQPTSPRKRSPSALGRVPSMARSRRTWSLSNADHVKSGKQRRKEIMARRHERAVLHSTEDVYAPPSTLPVGAAWANHAELAHNDNTYSLMPWFYLDRPFTCRDCGSFQIWTAKQQKWWYEFAKGHIHTTAVRCRPCRRIEEARKTQARRVHLEGLARKRASTRIPEKGDAATVALVALEDSMPTKRTRIAAKNQAMDQLSSSP